MGYMYTWVCGECGDIGPHAGRNGNMSFDYETFVKWWGEHNDEPSNYCSLEHARILGEDDCFCLQFGTDHTKSWIDLKVWEKAKKLQYERAKEAKAKIVNGFAVDPKSIDSVGLDIDKMWLIKQIEHAERTGFKFKVDLIVKDKEIRFSIPVKYLDVEEDK